MAQIDLVALDIAVGEQFILFKDYMRLAILSDSNCCVYYDTYRDIAKKLGVSYIQVLKSLKRLNRAGLIQDVHRKYIRLLHIKKE